MKNLNNINFIVGNKNFVKESYQPFSDEICNFLDQLSKNLINSKKSLEYSDVMAFAFFVEKNIINLKNKSFRLKNKKGLEYYSYYTIKYTN